jgi:hypothetical protein
MQYPRKNKFDIFSISSKALKEGSDFVGKDGIVHTARSIKRRESA